MLTKAFKYWYPPTAAEFRAGLSILSPPLKVHLQR